GVDVWYQPSDTFMTTGSMSASTIGPNYWARAAVGWNLPGWAWIGPEVMALGGDKYHQFRVGVHATAFRTAAYEWTAGFGYARDSDDRNGAYARLGVLTRR
ncbi:MAG TPA: cellulose biosynthesis protein BcsS, partial [Chthoniobacterales bacterium]|nr:cellulose biosynthesis protein BcsS [Chthoniobacterales bacterium]